MSPGTIVLADDPKIAVLHFLSEATRDLLPAALVVATTWLVAPRMSVFWLLAAILLGVVALTLLRIALPSLMFIDVFEPDSVRASTAQVWYRAGPLFVAWHHLLYGWLFAGAFALIHRVERTRAMLARAELARSQSETLLAQAELSNLRGAVDPAFLMRVLGEARRRPAEAAQRDGVLDRLVDFLRVAMPGIRSSGGSTLGAELVVMASRMRLACELEQDAPAWECDVDPPLAELPFPPLLLLPIVEHLASAGGPGGMIAAKATCDERGVTLTLLGTGRLCDPPDELLRRLRISLQAMHGQAADVAWHGDATSTGLSLRMRLAQQRPAEGASPAAADTTPPNLSSHGGALPWKRRVIPTN
jgi:hypothetical protein